MHDDIDHLLNATTDWLRNAFEILSASPDLVAQIDGLESWVPDSSGSLVRLRHTFFYSFRFSELIFENNPYWKQIESLIEFDPKLRLLSSSISNLTPNSWGRLPLSRVFNELLPSPMMRQGILVLPAPDSYEIRTRQFLSKIRSDFLNQIILWPITGLKASTPIELKGGYRFRSLTQDEKVRLLSLGIIRPPYINILPPNLTDWYGLARERQVKRFRNEAETNSGADPDETSVEDFLACASVATGHLVRHGGGQSTAPNLMFGGSAWSAASRSIDLSAYFIRNNSDPELSNSQRDQLLFIWDLLRSQRVDLKKRNKHDKALANAIRRVYLADTRIRPDEKLLDLIIAAESIYLNDESSEKRFRLSINAANFTEKATDERVEVFRAFKKAYDVRSSIVHGETVSTSVVQELVDIVRSTIFDATKRLAEIRRRAEHWPDWDKLLFSSTGLA